MLPAALRQYLEKSLQSSIRQIQVVGGGSIHRACTFLDDKGKAFFIKFNTGPNAEEMFRSESLGLTLLGASKTIAVPRIWKQDNTGDGWSFLLMDYISPGYKNKLFWERFGIELANLHGNTSASYGFSHDNFIGSLPQSNTRHERWVDFLKTERLEPQLKMAADENQLKPSDVKAMQGLFNRLEDLCPEEQPCLIHGDLWSGNFICDIEGRPVLIDPAACFAHREMDLAMSLLFGGFDQAFYNAYTEYWPLEPGFDDRLEIYQLYFLLAHVNLFGGSYIGQVQRILKKFI